MASWSEFLTLLGAVIVGYQWWSFNRLRSKLSHIPTLGSDWFILSYIDAWRLMFKGQAMIERGYRKFGKKPFKVPTLTTSSRWLVIICDVDMVEELRKAPEDVISFRGAAIDLLQSQYLIKDDVGTEPFHVPVVRGPLTKWFPERFSEVSDEVKVAVGEFINAGEDWKAVTIHEALIHIVCRTTNRFFVGLPLCRDHEYLKIQEEWTIKVIIGANILQLFPEFLKNTLAAMMLPIHTARRAAERLHGSLIQDRIDAFQKFGKKWEGRQNDLATWLVESAPPELRTVKDISVKVMLVNFAAIHTTSLTSTNALLDLAARQEYIAPLRAEIEENVAKHGWTKEAMVGMHKLDSFMKESARLAGISSIAMRRMGVKDYAFSNGVVIPAGVTVAVASGPMQLDPKFYENGGTFEGFRFFKAKDSDEEDPLRHQMVALDPAFMLFGYGRNACPGRFFVVNEVKAILAYLILNYDFKLPGDATAVPEGFWFAGNRSPSPSAQILFRKRHL